MNANKKGRSDGTTLIVTLRERRFNASARVGQNPASISKSDGSHSSCPTRALYLKTAPRNQPRAETLCEGV